MLNIEQALSQDRLLRALTGMNRKAFDTLLLTFTEVYEKSRQEKPRKRLFYFKCYPTFDLAGFMVGFDRSQAHYWVHRLPRPSG